MDIYSGQRCPLPVWARFFTNAGWQSVRFFGVVIGRYFIGVQAFSKSEVRKREEHQR